MSDPLPSTSVTPIALFAYNRPEHVARALTALMQCRCLDMCRLFIFCDGPRNDADGRRVEETRRVVRSMTQGSDASVVDRIGNRGLARSIVEGVSELVDRFDRVIVLEDDHEPGPDFLRYMLAALHRYKHEESVYQVSGYMFPLVHPTESDALFLPLTTTWGWGTWGRAWRAFDWAAEGALSAISCPETHSRFDLDDAYPYSRLLEDRLLGRNDSWGILWWWSVFKAGGMVLHPRRSLVAVGGFDGSGTHCGHEGWDYESQRCATLELRLGKILKFPERVTVDIAGFDRIKTFLRKRLSKRVGAQDESKSSMRA